MGIAFAGGTLISSTIFSLVSNIFSNLYSESAIEAPNFEELVDAIRRISECVFEEMKWTTSKPNFSFLIFGFCPRLKCKKLFNVGLDFTDGAAVVVASELDATEGRTYAIGSGRDAFSTIFQRETTNGEAKGGLPSLVYQTVASGLDAATGGSLTVATADISGVRLLPVGIPKSLDELETEISVTISGLPTETMDCVGDYSIGGTMIGAGINIAQNNQWLVKLGYDLNETDVTPSHRNLASLQLSLEYPPEDGSSIDLRAKDYNVVSPKFSPEKRFYSGSCSNCYLITPLIEVRQNELMSKPFKNGWISCVCMHCSLMVKFPAEKVFPQ